MFDSESDLDQDRQVLDPVGGGGVTNGIPLDAPSDIPSTTETDVSINGRTAPSRYTLRGSLHASLLLNGRLYR